MPGSLKLMSERVHSKKNGFGKIWRKTASFTPFSSQNMTQIGQNHHEISPTVKMGLRPVKEQEWLTKEILNRAKKFGMVLRDIMPSLADAQQASRDVASIAKISFERAMNLNIENHDFPWLV